MQLDDIDILVAARINFNKLREQTKNLRAAKTEHVCIHPGLPCYA